MHLRGRNGPAPRPGALVARYLALALLGLGGPHCSGGPHEIADGRLDDRPGEREGMVRTQIEARGVRDPAVLAALRSVPRHLFVPESQRAAAYADHPLPIGHDQTISQPYIVALMSELAGVGGGDRVLEIGTGSGYQTAVLAAMGCTVYSIEIVEPLARSAAERLAELGYDAVRVRAGDGYAGWPEEAPFDAVILTAAPRRIPAPLIDQVAVGGRLVAPEGETRQHLVVIERTAEGLSRRRVLPVRFVPMTGQAQRQEAERQEAERLEDPR